MQRYSLILWAKPNKEIFEVIAQRAYKLMMVIREFGEEIEPKYQTVNRKKDAVPFEWTYENFRTRLKDGVNKSGKRVFEELGYDIGFFSSLDDLKSAGISLNVGTSNVKFSNTLVIDFPIEMKFESKEKLERLEGLFKECVELFNPYWGAVINSQNGDRFVGYYQGGIPTTLHWINYLGDDSIAIIGEKRIMNDSIYEKCKINSGYYIRIKEKPIDDNSHEDIALQKQLNTMCGL